MTANHLDLVAQGTNLETDCFPAVPDPTAIAGPTYSKLLREAFPQAVITLLGQAPAFLSTCSRTDREIHGLDFVPLQPVVQIQLGDNLALVKPAVGPASAGFWRVDLYQNEQFKCGKRRMTLKELKSTLNP